jgi:putative DNA primase/helicase
MDNGIWRRVKLIPFDVTITRKRTGPKFTRKTEGRIPGILSWLCYWCLDWVAGGLQEPQKVTQSTQDYRSEMDATGRFLEEQTIEGAAYW